MFKSQAPKRANRCCPFVQGRSRQFCVWVVAAALCSGIQTLSAQTRENTPSSRPVPAHKVIPPRHKGSPAHAVVPAPVLEPPPPPPAPELPKWPVNDAPAPPAIRWDSQGLQVDAANSSLRQILDDVSTTTGAKIEGLGPDERVFGVYGPGPARDVISQILHGSSYNVLMLGDQGEGTPREVILSQRTRSAGSQSNQANNRPNAVQDEDTEQPEAEEPNQQNPINRPPLGQPIQPGGPMTPQQRMLEMQRQQMQLQQQQQQNQQIQPQQQQPQ